MKKLAAHWQILISLSLAILLGLVLRNFSTLHGEDSEFTKTTTTAIGWAKTLGDLFIRALKMIIVPLIVSSIVSGISSLAGFDGFRRLGLKTLSFYALTTLLATILGLSVVNVMSPGEVDGKPNTELQELFSANASTAQESAKERFSEERVNTAQNNESLLERILPTNIISASTDNGQLLGVLVFSIMLGIAMTQLPSQQMDPLKTVFQALNAVMIRITQWIMLTAPIGIFGLMLYTVYTMGAGIFEHLGTYFFTVLLALGLHMFVILPFLLKVIGRVNPWRHFRAMHTALLTAFSTASSTATLPITMRCIQDNAGVSKKTASFTLPLGATVNMDGTALYECIAVIFVAQVMGVDLSLGAQALVVISALVTSIGVAGVPSASLVAILIIMKTTEIPGAEAAILTLFAVDRLLDMCRTAVNVFGDSCAAVVIAKSEGETVLQGATHASSETP